MRRRRRKRRAPPTVPHDLDVALAISLAQAEGRVHARPATPDRLELVLRDMQNEMVIDTVLGMYEDGRIESFTVEQRPGDRVRLNWTVKAKGVRHGHSSVG